MFDRKTYEKEYDKKYYQEHKEYIDKRNREWRKNNKDKVLKSIYKSRKKRVEKLREQGVSNAWNVVVNGVEPRYKTERSGK